MPGNTKRRRRKQRGSKTGKVTGARGGRPRSRQEARAKAKKRHEDRRLSPPTWGGAVVRGVVAAVIFMVLLLIAFGRPIGEAFALAAFMLLLYIPMGYYMERFFWKRRMAREHRARAGSPR